MALRAPTSFQEAFTLLSGYEENAFSNTMFQPRILPAVASIVPDLVIYTCQQPLRTGPTQVTVSHGRSFGSSPRLLQERPASFKTSESCCVFVPEFLAQ